MKQGLAPWATPPSSRIWDKAVYIGDACSSVLSSRHFPWTDQLNIEVQKCLTGQITRRPVLRQPDQGIADAKRKV